MSNLTQTVSFEEKVCERLYHFFEVLTKCILLSGINVFKYYNSDWGLKNKPQDKISEYNFCFYDRYILYHNKTTTICLILGYVWVFIFN